MPDLFVRCGLNILDENVPLEQRDLLRAWGIHCCYWITTSVPRVCSGANRRHRASSAQRRQPAIPLHNPGKAGALAEEAGHSAVQPGGPGGRPSANDKKP